jgi:dolichyl-phosphate beta-glucosyltransferase
MKIRDNGQMISLILPVYNCFKETAGSLPILVNKLDLSGIPYELILVDDHSDDPKQIRDLAAANHCICLANEKNYGKGFSIRRGFARANGTILIFMDGDFPFDLEVIDRMIEVFRNEKMDIVIGDRTLNTSEYPAETTWLRKTGSTILSFFTSRYITPGFSDTQCGIKGFRKETAGQIFPLLAVDGFSFDIEILFVALRKKYLIRKIPVRARKQSSSNVRVFQHGIEMLANIVRIYTRKWRGLYKI